MSSDLPSRFGRICAISALTLAAAGPACGQMFQKSFGTTIFERAEWVQQTNDGGYIIVGLRRISTLSFPDAYVLKIDAAGVLQWDTQLIGSRGNIATNVVEVADGYVIAGETTSSSDPSLSMSLLKLDLSGNLLWAYAYPGTQQSLPTYSQTSLEPSGAADGGFILGARQILANGTTRAPILVRTDADGIMLWARYYIDDRYGSATNASFADVHPYVTFNGEPGLLACGYTEDALRESLLVATDMDGVVQWAKTYANANDTDWALGLDVAANGQILMNGLTTAPSAAGRTYVMRADQLGAALWYQTYSIFRPTSSMLETPSGDIVLGGISVDAALIEEPAIMLLNGAGAPLWMMSYGGSIFEYGECVVPTMDGGYKLAAWTSSFGQGAFDIYSIKTDAFGKSGCNERPMTPLVLNDVLEQELLIRDFALDVFEPLVLQEFDPQTIEEDLCPTGCICPADLNADCQVDLSDLAILLANFGTPAGATLADGDIDGDGDVDLADLALLLAAFGTVC